jgi:hypothetical protein
MLGSLRQDGPLQQGDIIRDVPFLVMPGNFNVKANETQGQVRLNCDELSSFEKVKEHAKDKSLIATAIPFVLQPGMVVTQSCDLEHKDGVTLARIFPIQNLIKGAREAIESGENLALYDMIRGITEGTDYPNLVYLTSLDDIGRCVADLSRVYSFPDQWKQCFRQKRWKSLKDEGIKYLQGRLSLYTGRFALDSGFWHVGDDAQMAELAKDQHAVEESQRRVAKKVLESRSNR